MKNWIRPLLRFRWLCLVCLWASTAPAFAQAVHYVKVNATGANNGNSWANAYTDLQNGINAANVGDEVWVAMGTYKPTQYPDASKMITSRYKSFHLNKDIKLFGGFIGTETNAAQRNQSINLTTLSGDFNDNDVITGNDSTLNVINDSENAYHVFITSNLTANAHIDGFTMKQGSTSGRDTITYGGNIFVTFRGGGMYNTASAPTIIKCNFINNFSKNSVAAGLYNYSSAPIVKNCSFSYNLGGYGSGMYNYVFSSPTLVDCLFNNNLADNNGAGLINAHYCSPTLINCVFKNNYANPSSGMGGGILNHGNSSPILINCTISSNSAPNGGGICNYQSIPQIKNTIIWGNTTNELVNSDAASIPVFYHSLIKNSGGSSNWNSYYGTNGGNNLDINPMFTQDLALQTGSPAINAGNNTYNTTTVDLAGRTRNQLGTIDMGAYEAANCNFLMQINTNAFVNLITAQSLTGTAPFTYRWNTGATTASIQSRILGIYTVSVTDANGCIATASILHVPTLPDSTVCMTRNQPLDLPIPHLNLPTATYNWYRNNELVDITTAPTLNINALQISDTGQYQVRFTIAPYPPVSFNVLRVKSCCTASTDTTRKTIRDGICIYWGGANRCTSGTYTEQRVGVSPTGCDSIRVLVLRVLPCNLQVAITQLGNRANALATNGIPPFTYLWENGATTPAISIQSQGTYGVTVTDSIGCRYTANRFLTPVNDDYRMDSIVMACQNGSGCTPIVLRNPVNNLKGYTIRLKFDSTQVRPDVVTNHRLGAMIPQPRNLRQFVNHDTLILTISLETMTNITGTIGQELICISWLSAVNNLPVNPISVLSGNIEASPQTGGLMITPVQTTLRIVASSTIQFWTYVNGVTLMAQNAAVNPTKVQTGSRGNMTDNGTVSDAGLFLMNQYNGSLVQFKRMSVLGIGIPEIDGYDAYQMNLVVADQPNAEQRIPRLLAMDVNGDRMITAGDITDVQRRAVTQQRGFRQANLAGDTIAWRIFPKTQLPTVVTRHYVPAIDTVFQPDSYYSNTCQTLPMDLVAILLGNVDNDNLPAQTKGKLSGTVTFDVKNAVKKSDTLRIPVYASEIMRGFSATMENYSPNMQLLAVTKGDASIDISVNIDATTRSCAISAFTTNANGILTNPTAPIAYLTVKTNCPFPNDFGTVKSYLNGQNAGSEVTSYCRTPTNELSKEVVTVFPNPTTGLITVQHEGISIAKILIFNAIGQIVKTAEPTANETQLDLSEWAKGVYFVKVNDKMFKIVKQ